MNRKWFVITVVGFFAMVSGFALDNTGAQIGIPIATLGLAALLGGFYVHAKEGWEEAAPE